MPLACVAGVVAHGLAGQLVDVHVHLANGLPSMTIVGLADTAVSESRDRVRSAVVNSGLDWPSRRITVGLSPASEQKRGSGLDLAVAVAVLAASGAVPARSVAGAVFVGELALDGSLRPIRGAIAMALAIGDAMGPEVRVFTSRTMAPDMALVPGIDVIPAAGLGAVVAMLRGERRAESTPGNLIGAEVAAPEDCDLRDVVGQAEACTALEVAAAGGHHMLLEGPPGVGKTMLAERLRGLLPQLGDRQALEVSAIRGAANGSTNESPTRLPPFVGAHHSASHAAMVGSVHGGVARPGLISLAHRGVLFLDEAPEFHRVTLEALRQPMESGQISIARSGLVDQLPALFQLVLTANLCPCGGMGRDDSQCRCSSMMSRRYRDRLSRPLRDRIDLRVRISDPVGRRPADSSAEVRERVLAARRRAEARCGMGVLNSRVSAGVLRGWSLPESVGSALDRWVGDQPGSMRARDRIVRVCWTLADLNDREQPTVDDMALAVCLNGRAGDTR
ncbi:MAG: YifB family Mg chelatase-like AAA ATPase [Candidatus Nanopelagicales bacterium]|nr:YifB family Mg chelatase-like AAA ATPase [Candidatus Nanopelagicales bacterium]